MLWEQNPDSCSSANKIAESGSSYKQIIPSPHQKKNMDMSLLEDLTAPLTERTRAIQLHLTPQL